MAIVTIRLSSERFVTTEDGQRVQYDPRLRNLPLQFGSRLSAAQPGQEGARREPNGGVIQFALDAAAEMGGDGRSVWGWFDPDQHWQGREFRVYRGNPGDRHEDLQLVYVGRVEDVAHDTLTATLRTTSGRVDLDNNVVEDMYERADDNPETTVPEAIQGRPKPYVEGYVRGWAPVLTDPAGLVYDISTASGSPAIDEVVALYVGGIAWVEVAGTPGPAQFAVDQAAGTVTLGGETAGGEVRVDVRMAGWESLTTAALVRRLVEAKGAVVNEASMSALDAAAPYLIGWGAHTEPVNRLNALDEIMAGIGGWWGDGDDASIVAGVRADAAPTPNLRLTALGIVSLQQSGLIPPAWRIRIEHSRNWHPQSTFFGAVSEEDQQRWREGGSVAPEWAHETIKDEEPRAVDVPLIRSLVQSEADAIAIRDRLASVWGTPRRLYDVAIRTAVPALYDTVGVDYRMVLGNFRVESVLRSIGGGASVLQLCGTPIARPAAGETVPVIIPPPAPVASYLLAEDGGYLLAEDGSRIVIEG